jgi:hypothetical protein
MKKLVAFALAAGLLAACGGGGGTSVPNAPGSAAPSARKAAVTFTIELPDPEAASSAKRSPRYVSPATLSAVVTLTQYNGAPVAGPPYAVNIGSLNGCSNVAPEAILTKAVPWPLGQMPRATTCSFSIPALVGTDTFAVALYDAAQTSATPATLAGNVLSLGTSAPIAVVENTANVVPITLIGVIAYLQLTISPADVAPGSNTTLTLLVSAQDADHKGIRLPGAYAAPIVLTSNQPVYTIAPASLMFPGDTATTTYPGSNELVSCNPTSFTATSGSVATTTALTIDPSDLCPR